MLTGHAEMASQQTVTAGKRQQPFTHAVEEPLAERQSDRLLLPGILGDCDA